VNSAYFQGQLSKALLGELAFLLLWIDDWNLQGADNRVSIVLHLCEWIQLLPNRQRSLGAMLNIFNAVALKRKGRFQEDILDNGLELAEERALLELCERATPKGKILPREITESARLGSEPRLTAAGVEFLKRERHLVAGPEARTLEDDDEFKRAILGCKCERHVAQAKLDYRTLHRKSPDGWKDLTKLIAIRFALQQGLQDEGIMPDEDQKKMVTTRAEIIVKEWEQEILDGLTKPAGDVTTPQSAAAQSAPMRMKGQSDTALDADQLLDALREDRNPKYQFKSPKSLQGALYRRGLRAEMRGRSKKLLLTLREAKKRLDMPIKKECGKGTPARKL